jgi:hypothetical protein
MARSYRYGLYNQRIGNIPKGGSFDYKGWSKGQNSFSEPNEIRDDEIAKGRNIMIVGKGSIQMPMNGSELLTSTVASNCNGAFIFKDKTSGTETPLFFFDGRLYKYVSNSLVEIDNTKSWTPNLKMGGIMFRDQFYFCNGTDSLCKTDLSTITEFTEISDPTTINVSYTGSLQEATYRFAVSVVTATGETASVASSEYLGAFELNSSEKFTISTPRNSNSAVKGYNFYVSKNGSRFNFLIYVPQPPSGDPSVSYEGQYLASSIYTAPDYNTTGGVKGKLFATFKDTLFVAGVDDLPDYIFYTGTGNNYESFSPDTNGGWARVGEGDGTRVNQIKGFDVYLLIIKENSIYKFDFLENGGSNVTIVEPLYGSPYSYSVEKFEKDLIMASNDNRIRTLGYEPNLLNVIRTTDISNRVQPILDNEFDFSVPQNVIGVYYKQKYILCDGNIAVCYDRQYTGFHGEAWENWDYSAFLIWKTGGKELLLGAKNDGTINKLLVDGVYTNNGQPIVATFRPKTVDGGEQGLIKFFKFYKLKIKNFSGTMNLSTWYDGITVPDSTSLSVVGSGGISAFMWGEPMWGEVKVVQMSSNFETLGNTILVVKELCQEAHYLVFEVTVNGNEDNHLVLQGAVGVFDYGDVDYLENENILN